MNFSDGYQLNLGTNVNGDPYNFFIVDDSGFMIKNLERIIRSLNGNVVGNAFNGVEAIEKYPQLKEKIDIVTLDITMPQKDGIQTLKELKEINPDIIVIMISALGHETMVREALSLGAKYFIVKPFKRESVFRVFSLIIKKFLIKEA